MYSFKHDVYRLGQAILGKHKPLPDGTWPLQPGRKSAYKGWFFEITHATKNVFVELLRDSGIWNRKTQADGK